MSNSNNDTTSTHTADAAGGEAIYSSDGLSPIPIPIPPPRFIPNKNNDCNDDDMMDTIEYESSKNNVIQAFEVFSGKVFANDHSSHSTTFSTGGRMTHTSGNQESRLQKLARIQAELNELERDFNFSNHNNIDNTIENDDNRNIDEEERGQEEIRKVIHDLTSKLDSLQNGIMNMDITKRQQQLTSYIKNNLSTSYQEQQQQEQKQQNEKDDSQKLTQMTSNSIQQGLSYEQRLLRIEQFLGSTEMYTDSTSGISGSIGGIYTNDNHKNMTILERLKLAEDKLNSVDETKLNMAASRAKVIRADLEAAAKARSKINNTTNIEDAAKIEKLHNQLMEMDGFLSSNILSTIVNRLSTCASLHTQSMEFRNTLHVLEDKVKDLEITLSSVDESVKIVEKGLEENMKVIQKNMERI